MLLHKTFSCSVRGFSHVQKGTVCEDFSECTETSEFCIAAVADGHGDPSCFRSNVGSRLAVQTAIRHLQKNADVLSSSKDLSDSDQQEKFIRPMIQELMDEWRELVLRDLSEHPITDEEYERSGKHLEEYRSGENLLHIFGTTLIAALYCGSHLLVIHQGDGRCLTIHRDGSYHQDVPWDLRCAGNRTTSLCAPDAVQSFRYYLADLKETPIAACILGTDGVEDSYPSMDASNAFMGYLSACCAEHGTEQLTEELKDYLPKFSKYGSMDDISVAGIVFPDLIHPIHELLELQHKYLTQRTSYVRSEEKLQSMNRKLLFLKDQVQSEEDNTEYQSYLEKYRSYEAKSAEAKCSMDELQCRINELKELASSCTDADPVTDESFFSETDHNEAASIDDNLSPGPLSILKRCLIFFKKVDCKIKLNT